MQNTNILFIVDISWLDFLSLQLKYFMFLAATAALEVQMLVCVSVSVSHLLQLYLTSAGLRQDF